MEIHLKVRDAVKQHIVDEAYDPKYGARPLRRKIQMDLEDVLAEKILSGEISSGDEVVITMRRGQIIFDRQQPKG